MKAVQLGRMMVRTQLRNPRHYGRTIATSTETQTGDLKKRLFTPGPLGVSASTKEAMLVDWGSREPAFIQLVRDIRADLLKLAGVSGEEYTCIPLQGSGTYTIEAVLGTTVPREGAKVLILENGAYGRRQVKICEVLGIPHQHEAFSETGAVDVDRVREIFSRSGTAFTHVSTTHCETSSGVFNDVETIGKIIKQYSPKTKFFVDGMSSFGAVPLDMKVAGVEYLVSSANKCIEGVPGFAYVIAKTEDLLQCKGQARSYSLDLVDQYEGLEANGQFRFTPPTHAMLAFHQALKELMREGGVAGRANRYKENQRLLHEGMADMGFKELLDEKDAGYIITSFEFPKDPKFDFNQFYELLYNKGQVIYPGKLLKTDCFRLGNIGHVYPEDIAHLLQCIRNVCQQMHLSLPVKQTPS